MPTKSAACTGAPVQVNLRRQNIGTRQAEIAQNQEEDASAEKDENFSPLHEKRNKLRWLRIATVVGYVISLSSPAFVLSSYYIFLWPIKPYNVTADVLAQNRVVRHINREQVLHFYDSTRDAIRPFSGNMQASIHNESSENNFKYDNQEFINSTKDQNYTGPHNTDNVGGKDAQNRNFIQKILKTLAADTDGKRGNITKINFNSS